MGYTIIGLLKVTQLVLSNGKILLVAPAKIIYNPLLRHLVGNTYWQELPHQVYQVIKLKILMAVMNIG